MAAAKVPTKKQLIAEARALQKQIDARADSINRAIEKGRLPKSVRDVGFFNVYSQGGYKLSKPISKMNKAELTRAVNIQKRATNLSTFTNKGIRERLNELNISAGGVLAAAGLPNVEGLSRVQKSKMFQLAELLAETYGYDSDESFRAAVQTYEGNKRSSETISKFVDRITAKTDNGRRELKESVDQMIGGVDVE